MHLCRRRCVEPENVSTRVLRALQDAAELYDGRSWLNFTRDSWYFGSVLDHLPNSDDLDTETIARLARGEVELQYILRLLDALTSSASDLLVDYRRRLGRSTSKLSKGLTSLPDELLSLVFRFAVQKEGDGTRSALRLSQVSRRFRRAIIGDHNLWTTQFLWYDTTEESVKRCIGRAGKDSDLQLVANWTPAIYFSRFSIVSFFETCRPFMSRWSSLTLFCKWVRCEHGEFSSVGRMFIKMGRDKNWVLPRLHELVLNQQHCDEKGEKILCPPTDRGSFHELSCIAPNLQVLRCSQYIPPPTFSFRTISHFYLSLILIPPNVHEQLQQLLEFLCSMENLTEVDLELLSYGNMDYSFENEMEYEYDSICTAVKVFRFKVTDFSLENGGSWPFRSFFEMLSMPVLDHYSLTITLTPVDIYYAGSRGHDAERLLSELTSILLPAPSSRTLRSVTIVVPFPKLESLLETIWWEPEPMLLTIPLDEIPQISTLDLQMFCRVAFSRDECSIRDEDCSLKELRLSGCGHMSTDHIRGAIESLKKVDAWDALEIVDIRECDLLDYDSALQIVGKERLRFAK